MPSRCRGSAQVRDAGLQHTSAIMRRRAGTQEGATNVAAGLLAQGLLSFEDRDSIPRHTTQSTCRRSNYAARSCKPLP